MIEFDYHIKQVTAYAFYNGQMRGLAQMLNAGLMTQQEFQQKQEAADQRLHQTLKQAHVEDTAHSLSRV